MTTTFLVMAAVAVVAGMAAWWQQHQHRPVPISTPGAPPGTLDRSDFRAPDAPLLIAVFTSSTCSSCEAVWAELSGYESPAIATQNVDVKTSAALHKRYQIDSVPTAVIVNRAGDTQAAFVGPVGPEHRKVLGEIVASSLPG